jgi:hypothetical protein
MEIESRFLSSGIDAQYERVFAAWRQDYSPALDSHENRLELQSAIDDLVELTAEHGVATGPGNNPKLLVESRANDGLIMRRLFKINGPDNAKGAEQSFLLSCIGKYGGHIMTGRIHGIFQIEPTRFVIEQRRFYLGHSSPWMRGVEVQDSSSITRYDFDDMLQQARILEQYFRAEP